MKSSTKLVGRRFRGKYRNQLTSLIEGLVSDVSDETSRAAPKEDGNSITHQLHGDSVFGLENCSQVPVDRVGAIPLVAETELSIIIDRHPQGGQILRRSRLHQIMNRGCLDRVRT